MANPTRFPSLNATKYAKHVGRVGLLALALGVGAATTTPTAQGATAIEYGLIAALIAQQLVDAGTQPGPDGQLGTSDDFVSVRIDGDSIGLPHSFKLDLTVTAGADGELHTNDDSVDFVQRG